MILLEPLIHLSLNLLDFIGLPRRTKLRGSDFACIGTIFIHHLKLSIYHGVGVVLDLLGLDQFTVV